MRRDLKAHSSWSLTSPSLPLLPTAAAIIVALLPTPRSVVEGGLTSTSSFLVLKADLFFAFAYLGGVVAVVTLLLAPNRWTALTGFVSCALPLNMVYLWTATHERYFSWMVVAVAFYTGRPGLDPYLDVLTIGLVVLASAIPLATWLRRSLRLAILRFVEAGSAAVLPLGVYIYLIDRQELNFPVVTGVRFPTNAELLFISAMLLAAGLAFEYENRGKAHV